MKKKMKVPMGCILSVGTVPTGCLLSVGTVPMGCILTVRTVPTDNLSQKKSIIYLKPAIIQTDNCHSNGMANPAT